jgi:hypothetical protein
MGRLIEFLFSPITKPMRVLILGMEPSLFTMKLWYSGILSEFSYDALGIP